MQVLELKMVLIFVTGSFQEFSSCHFVFEQIFESVLGVYSKIILPSFCVPILPFIYSYLLFIFSTVLLPVLELSVL